jgi:hypothetical protein
MVNQGFAVERRNYSCGLEIKTQFNKKFIQVKIRQCVDLHSAFSYCDFGGSVLKQLIYKPEY